ncbi:flavodoxin domain-containing protein [Klenkia terrae]|uniref:Flavodoxin domain-containing protein n=1 Tax=Klenkia terrae TaxID=1052259 RepID=A0ABU8EBD8_9ACTN|nr:flavodoxin domain-containing protein [Klenkia terrae]
MTVASKHGSTAELAERLAVDLQESVAGRRCRLTAACRRVEQDPDPAQFDAVVLGSSVYAGRWAEPARRWANQHLVTLRRRPVWLLSSGPIGEHPFPPDEAHDIGPLADELLARGQRTLPGRLDPARLGFGERAVVTAMRAPHGDFRDWTALRSWAEEIASQLELSPAGAAQVGTAPR